MGAREADRRTSFVNRIWKYYRSNKKDKYLYIFEDRSLRTADYFRLIGGDGYIRDDRVKWNTLYVYEG